MTYFQACRRCVHCHFIQSLNWWTRCLEQYGILCAERITNIFVSFQPTEYSLFFAGHVQAANPSRHLHPWGANLQPEMMSIFSSVSKKLQANVTVATWVFLFDTQTWSLTGNVLSCKDSSPHLLCTNKTYATLYHIDSQAWSLTGDVRSCKDSSPRLLKNRCRWHTSFSQPVSQSKTELSILAPLWAEHLSWDLCQNTRMSTSFFVP